MIMGRTISRGIAGAALARAAATARIVTREKRMVNTVG